MDPGVVQLQVGHVHAEIVLYDTRNAVDRVLAALRRFRLVGFVEPAHSVADRLGMVRALVATHENHAVVTAADGIQVGPSLEELAASLRSQLSAGVMLIDHEVGPILLNAPPLVAERMQAAEHDTHPIRTVFTFPTGDEMGDDGSVATLVGGAATTAVVDGRRLLVVEQSRPGSLFTHQRPAVQVTAQDNKLSVMLWTKHSVRWWQSPLNRLRRFNAPDVIMNWVGTPIRIATPTPPSGGDPARVAVYELETSFHEQAEINTAPIMPGLRRITSELALPPDAAERLETLQREPWSEALLGQVVAAFGLPAVVADLATGALSPAALDGAHTIAAPDGLIHRRIERKRGFR
jgi:hypothetical protein